MFEVFISHSTKNRIIADALKHNLERNGIRCWKAPDNILPGQVWEVAITDAIRSCQIMLLIWSSDSQESRQVQRELSVAANAGKVVIPYRIEDIEPAGLFEYYLTNTHWLDAYSQDVENALQEVVRRVSAILGIVENDLRLDHRRVIDSEKLNTVNLSPYQHLLASLLPNTPLVKNQAAAQALFQESLDEHCPKWPELTSIGYISIPAPGKSTKSTDLHFCDNGIAIFRNLAPPIFIRKNNKIEINSFQNEIVVGTASIRTKGFGRSLLQRITNCMSTWISYDHLVYSAIDPFLAKYIPYSLSCDNFYPSCSGGLEEECDDCERSYNSEIPLVSLDQKVSIDSNQEYEASISFYRNRISVASTFPGPVVRQSWWPCSQPVGKNLQDSDICLLLRPFFYHESQDRPPQHVLCQQVVCEMFSEWIELVETLPATVVAPTLGGSGSSSNALPSSAKRQTHIRDRSKGTELQADIIDRTIDELSPCVQKDRSAGGCAEQQPSILEGQKVNRTANPLSCPAIPKTGTTPAIHLSPNERSALSLTGKSIVDEINLLLSLSQEADALDRPSNKKFFKDRSYFEMNPREWQQLLRSHRRQDLRLHQFHLFIDFKEIFSRFCGLLLCDSYVSYKDVHSSKAYRFNYILDGGSLHLDVDIDADRAFFAFYRGDDELDIYTASPFHLFDGNYYQFSRGKTKSFLENALPNLLRKLVMVHRLKI